MNKNKLKKKGIELKTLGDIIKNEMPTHMNYYIHKEGEQLHYTQCYDQIYRDWWSLFVYNYCVENGFYHIYI